MNSGEMISMALGNLWRMKLRSFLTISGVIIGIAALISMMSLGVGLQKNVKESFDKLEIFTMLEVSEYKSDDPAVDSTLIKPLNDSALIAIQRIPGVSYAYSSDPFPIQIEYDGKTESTMAYGMPAAEGEIEAYQELSAGRFFQSDSAPEVVLHQRILKDLGIENPDSAIGQQIALISAKIDFEAAFRSFMQGGMNLRSLDLQPFAEDRKEMTICGVLKQESGMGFILSSLILPTKTAQSFEKLSFKNPFELLHQMQGEAAEGYDKITVRVKSMGDFDSVRDAVEEMGFDTRSFIDEFDEMRKGFLIFDSLLAIVGFIALTVAALGIINTMVMSIIERYREIGILKSLGANEGWIRQLFLIEAGVIGFIGAVLGIILGFIMTRIGALIAVEIMRRQGGPQVDPFYIPLWLAGLGLAFGLVVSLAAGFFPSLRAAQVNPVKALRND